MDAGCESNVNYGANTNRSNIRMTKEMILCRGRWQLADCDTALPGNMRSGSDK